MQVRKLLITGGSGYLGRYLTALAASQYDVYAGYLNRPDVIVAGMPVRIDLSDRSAMDQCLNEVQPDAVINTAAINPGGPVGSMEVVNAWGAGYLADACMMRGLRFIQVSTDIVHDGTDAPYTDDCSPTPINEYGRTKAAGEAAILNVHPGAVIVRTSLIYGIETMDRGTAGFADRLRRGEPLVLFHDVIRQPLWIDTLSRALLELILTDYSGLLNIAGCQALSREEFGRRMLAFWKVPVGNGITSGSGAAFSSSIPLDLRLTLDLGRKVLRMDFPGVDDVLQEIQRTKVR